MKVELTNGYYVETTYLIEWDLTLFVINGVKLIQPYVSYCWGNIVDIEEVKSFAEGRIDKFTRVSRYSERIISTYKVVKWDGKLKSAMFDNLSIIEFKEDSYVIFNDPRVGKLKADIGCLFLVNKLGHLEDITDIEELQRLYIPAVGSMAQINLEELYK